MTNTKQDCSWVSFPADINGQVRNGHTRSAWAAGLIGILCLLAAIGIPLAEAQVPPAEIAIDKQMFPNIQRLRTIWRFTEAGGDQGNGISPK